MFQSLIGKLKMGGVEEKPVNGNNSQFLEIQSAYYLVCFN